jgi:hypothetical protein
MLGVKLKSFYAINIFISPSTFIRGATEAKQKAQTNEVQREGMETLSRVDTEALHNRPFSIIAQ